VITAVDTSVLLDVFRGDPQFGPRSAAALRRCLAEGSLIACEAVWAETGASFADAAQAEKELSSLRIGFSALDSPISLTAGQAWRAYRKAGGIRKRVVADFLIGAHALARADRLLTRDRGFYRKYFTGLEILDPSDEPERPPNSAGAGTPEEE
jgi:predicted nucleic acid-binding protein